MDNPYDDTFFESHRVGSLESARQIVPFLIDLVGCRSVVDVGCGSGNWLAAFQENGITDFRGIDGSYVNQDRLAIPKEHFRTADLREPLQADRSFDLAMSVEVAEHLPASASGPFLDLLTTLSPVVLFSASLPFQDGTNHVNEQWLEHWVALFQQRGFRAVDCVRPKFWNNPRVEWWYCQNAILYVAEEHLARYPRIEALARTSVPPTTWVHPNFLIHKENMCQHLPPLRDAWGTIFQRSWRALLSRFGG